MRARAWAQMLVRSGAATLVVATLLVACLASFSQAAPGSTADSKRCYGCDGSAFCRPAAGTDVAPALVSLLEAVPSPEPAATVQEAPRGESVARRPIAPLTPRSPPDLRASVARLTV